MAIGNAVDRRGADKTVFDGIDVRKPALPDVAAMHAIRGQFITPGSRGIVERARKHERPAVALRSNQNDRSPSV